MGGLRQRLSFANVMATIAVCLSLAGGVAWALERNSVRSRHIVSEQVRKSDIANSALFSSGRVELVADDTAELYASGPLTITAECTLPSPPTFAQITVDTDAPHSSVAGKFSDADYGPEETPPAVASAASADSSVVAEQFSATAPNGTTLTGVAVAGVNVDPDPDKECLFALAILG